MELSLRDIRTIAHLAEWRRIRLTSGAWRKPGWALKTPGVKIRLALANAAWRHPRKLLAVSRPFGATSRVFQEFPLSVVPLLDCGFPIFIVHQNSAFVRFILFAFAPIT
jgi:hypothetical protein